MTRFLIPFMARVRQLLAFVFLVAAYLCTGAAWKVWMVVRHPPQDTTFTDALYTALRPYSSLPVGYALGPSFGRLASSLRLAARATDEKGDPAREAARLDSWVVNRGGNWADAAAFALASLEQRSGAQDKSEGQHVQTLWIILDGQRWGRTTWPLGARRETARERFRRLLESSPHSPPAIDALDRLAAMEQSDWEFYDARVCRAVAALLDPTRVQSKNAVEPSLRDPKQGISALAASYYLYLNSNPDQRVSQSPGLRQLALASGDLVLARWLEKTASSGVPVSPTELPRAGTASPGSPVLSLSQGAGTSRQGRVPSPGAPLLSDPTALLRSGAFPIGMAPPAGDAGISPGPPPDGSTLQVTWNGKPMADGHAAILQAGNLQRALQVSQAFAGRSQQSSPVSAGEIERTIDELNRARPDDPLRPVAMVLISPDMAARIAETLPGATTGPDGVAHFPNRAAGLMGTALLVNPPPGAEDLSLSPSSAPSGATGATTISFVPRVQVLPPILSPAAPPVLRWSPYPGAAQYRVVVALEPPAPRNANSTALSPDWDRHVLWWQDGVRDNSVAMRPQGFVGPPADLTRNGLWVGDVSNAAIYRVMIVAEDTAGRPIASSIGFQDHPEEFFTPPANWLALDGKDARGPALTSTASLQGGLWFGPHKRRRRQSRRDPADPLEQVLEIARSLAPPTVTGSGTREPELTPVPAHSLGAVHLANWPALVSQGQGPIPLQNPFLQQLSPDSASSPGLASAFGIPADMPGFSGMGR